MSNAEANEGNPPNAPVLIGGEPGDSIPWREIAGQAKWAMDGEHRIAVLNYRGPLDVVDTRCPLPFVVMKETVAQILMNEVDLFRRSIGLPEDPSAWPGPLAMKLRAAMEIIRECEHERELATAGRRWMDVVAANAQKFIEDAAEKKQRGVPGFDL